VVYLLIKERARSLKRKRVFKEVKVLEGIKMIKPEYSLFIEATAKSTS
jgi:hypothetical protein